MNSWEGKEETHQSTPLSWTFHIHDLFICEMRMEHLPRARRPASTEPRKASSWKASSQAPCFTHPGVRAIPCRKVCKEWLVPLRRVSESAVPSRAGELPSYGESRGACRRSGPAL